MEKLEIVDLSVRGGRREVGRLTRQVLHEGDGRFFRVRGADVEATRDGDVFLQIWQRGVPSDPGHKIEYPVCPDCRTSGSIVWMERGYVPGTRECQGCRSLFADSRFATSGYFDTDAIVESARASGLGTIYPQTRAARTWLEKHVEFAEWQRLDSGGLLVDARFLDEVVEGMLTDGQTLLALTASGLFSITEKALSEAKGETD